MKFLEIATIFAFVINLTSATIVAKDINVIIERTEASIAETQKLLTEHKNNNRGHLLDSAQHEFEYLQKLVPLIKNLTKTLSLRTNQLNKVEEVLLRRENAITDELYFVEEVYRNYKPNGTSSDELIQFAEKLIKLANVEIAKSDYKHVRWEIIQLQKKVKDMEKLIKDIQNHPKDVKKNEMRERILVGSEKTMRNIIEKLNNEF